MTGEARVGSLTRTDIEVVPVGGRLDRERFLRLPDRLHARDRWYVPPLMAQRRAQLSPAGNPWHEHGEAALFLARRNGRIIGRISAQVDRLAVERHGPVGHFGLLAAEEKAVVPPLLRAAEAWLAGHGMQRARGPFNLSINQEAGLLVAGFDCRPMLMMGHDAPHLGPALEAAGYRKARDLLAYRVPVVAEQPRFVRSLLARAETGRIHLRPIRMGEVEAEVGRALAIFNDAWAGNWGFVPFTQAEMAHLTREMRPIIDPRLVWFAEVDGEAAGMLIALPDVNEAIHDLGGRLLPFGWARALWRMKVAGVKGARVPLMGVRRVLHGTALGAALPFLMTEALRPALKERGYERVEMSWILEDNLPMRRMAEALSGRLAKTYRIYERELP